MEQAEREQENGEEKDEAPAEEVEHETSFFASTLQSMKNLCEEKGFVLVSARSQNAGSVQNPTMPENVRDREQNDQIENVGTLRVIAPRKPPKLNPASTSQEGRIIEAFQQQQKENDMIISVLPSNLNFPDEESTKSGSNSSCSKTELFFDQLDDSVLVVPMSLVPDTNGHLEQQYKIEDVGATRMILTRKPPHQPPVPTEEDRMNELNENGTIISVSTSQLSSLKFFNEKSTGSISNITTEQSHETLDNKATAVRFTPIPDNTCNEEPQDQTENIVETRLILPRKPPKTEEGRVNESIQRGLQKSSRVPCASSIGRNQRNLKDNVNLIKTMLLSNGFSETSKNKL